MDTIKRPDPFPTPYSRMCFWYYRGETSKEPRVAIITSAGRCGVFSLHVFNKDQHSVILVTGAHHKDDPFLAKHPTHVSESGCWDYLPHQDCRLPEVQEPELTDTDHGIPSGAGSRAFKNKK